jgi:hypothetical protein
MMMAALGCKKSKTACSKDRHCVLRCSGETGDDEKTIVQAISTASAISPASSCCQVCAPFTHFALVTADKSITYHLNLASALTAPLQIPATFPIRCGFSEEPRAGPHHKCSFQSLHCIWHK